MNRKISKIHPSDNVLIALTNLEVNEKVNYNGDGYTLVARIPAKHKFVTTGLCGPTGNPIAPVFKLTGNTAMFIKMNDIIDINTGSIIEGGRPLSGRRSVFQNG
jgi:hypothetical protein